MSRILVYLTLLLIGGLSACSDHLIPAVAPGSTTTRLRVKTITQELPNNLAKVSSFRYDAQGRLSSILTYQTPDSTVSEIEYSNYQYDGQNRLTGLRHEAVAYPRGSRSNRVEGYSYSYNAAGQVSGVSYLNGFSLTFAYNGSNQLVSSNRQFLFSGVDQSGSDSFTFTGDNLTILNSFRTIPTRGPGGNFTSRADFTYDDKVNPFYGVYVIPAPYPAGFVDMRSSPGTVETYFGGIENVLNLSRNNVLRKDVTSFTTIAGSPTIQTGLRSVYQYQYNSANLPTVRTTTNLDLLVETLRFEYESY